MNGSITVALFICSVFGIVNGQDTNRIAGLLQCVCNRDHESKVGLFNTQMVPCVNGKCQGKWCVRQHPQHNTNYDFQTYCELNDDHGPGCVDEAQIAKGLQTYRSCYCRDRDFCNSSSFAKLSAFILLICMCTMHLLS